MGSAPPSPARTQKAVKSRHTKLPKNAEQARTRPSAAQGRQCRRDRHIKRAGAAGSRPRAGTIGGGLSSGWAGWARQGPAGPAGGLWLRDGGAGRVRGAARDARVCGAVMDCGRCSAEGPAGSGRAGPVDPGRAPAGVSRTARPVRALPPGQRLAAGRGRSAQPPRPPSR